MLNLNLLLCSLNWMYPVLSLVGLIIFAGSLLPSLVVLGQDLSRPWLETSYRPANCSIGTAFHSSSDVIRWSHRSESNRQPTVYKTVVLPLNYSGVVFAMRQHRIVYDFLPSLARPVSGSGLILSRCTLMASTEGFASGRV